MFVCVNKVLYKPLISLQGKEYRNGRTISENIFKTWVVSAQDEGLLERPCECGIQLPGFISHVINYMRFKFKIVL